MSLWNLHLQSLQRSCTRIPGDRFSCWSRNVIKLNRFRNAPGSIGSGIQEVEDDLPIFVAALKACSILKDEFTGKMIHDEALSCGCGSNIYICNSLISMYAKCGSVAAAHQIFDKIQHRTPVSWNALMLGCVENGEEETALELFSCMQAQGCTPGVLSFVAALKACSKMAAKEEAKLINGKPVKLRYLGIGVDLHSKAAATGCELDVLVASTLVDMYAKCGSMPDARLIFDRITCPSVVSWTSLILGYAENGEEELALEMFYRMQNEGCIPDARAFVAALKACSCLAAKEDGVEVCPGKTVKAMSLERGLRIHMEVAKRGCEQDIFVGSTLIDMYAKCGCIEDAVKVFKKMLNPNVVSWNALMLGCVENGEEKLALELYTKILRAEGCGPNALTFVAALKACSCLAGKEEGMEVDGDLIKVFSIEKGRLIHSEAGQHQYDSDVFVANTAMDMYAKCGSLVEAREVFDRMSCRSVVSWNTMMLGYAEKGEGGPALALFGWMLKEAACAPNPLSFVAALKACSNLAAQEMGKSIDGKILKILALERGKAVHSEAGKFGCETGILIRNTLVSFYAKCGSLVDARRVFDRMPCHSSVSWNALIMGYAEQGEACLALEIFRGMQSCAADAMTFVAALKACTSLAAKEEATRVDGKLVKLKTLQEGMGVHFQASERGLESDIFVACSLVDMYAKCGSVLDARRIFDRLPVRNAVLWNTLILGYGETVEGELALELFDCMQGEGFLPDARSFLSVLRACSSLAADEAGIQVDGKLVKVDTLERTMSLHSQALKSGCKLDTFFSNTLIDVYAKCGSMMDARIAFDRMAYHDEVSWTTLMLGYAEGGEERLALQIFTWRLRTCEASPLNFIGALKACGSLADSEAVRAVHANICRTGMIEESIVVNSLVDAYGKCGSSAQAQWVFDSVSRRDVVTWNALIAGYSRAGSTDQVLSLFGGMRGEGVEPDGITFLCVLTSCSHAGLVDKGKRYFDSMLVEHGVAPQMQHYISMIDTFGRGNRLQDAIQMVKEMPHEANALTWRTVLGACHKWKDVIVGKTAFESLLKVDGSDNAAFVLMANIYSSRSSSEV